MSHVELRQGDLFTSQAAALVNPVNCLGVSGKGLAKIFRDWAPDAQSAYRRFCHEHELRPGHVLRYPTTAPVRRGEYKDPVWIYYFATKDHWQNPSQLEWIRQGLDRLVDLLAGASEPIAIPALGCGNGELSWDEVRPLIQTAAERMPCPVWIYEPL